MTKTLKRVSTIPSFKNFEEEAALGDSHDTADLIEHGRRVRMKFVPKTGIVSIRLDRRKLTQEQFARRARKRFWTITDDLRQRVSGSDAGALQAATDEAIQAVRQTGRLTADRLR